MSFVIIIFTLKEKVINTLTQILSTYFKRLMAFATHRLCQVRRIIIAIVAKSADKSIAENAVLIPKNTAAAAAMANS